MIGDYNENFDEESERRFVEEYGAVREIIIQDGRLDADELQQTSTLIVFPVLSERNLYCVKLQTSHYSFSISSSTVKRGLDSFYQLRSIIKDHHTYLTVPSLPLQPRLWVSSYKTISQALVTFLAELLQFKELLSNKAVHLFLQTQVNMHDILGNINGERDDEIVPSISKVFNDDRQISREGFGTLFGGSNLRMN